MSNFLEETAEIAENDGNRQGCFEERATRAWYGVLRGLGGAPNATGKSWVMESRIYDTGPELQHARASRVRRQMYAGSGNGSEKRRQGVPEYDRGLFWAILSQPILQWIVMGECLSRFVFR